MPFKIENLTGNYNCCRDGLMEDAYFHYHFEIVIIFI